MPRRTVELGHLTVAQDLVKFLLVSRETDRGRGKMLDCYDASFVLGAMVPEGAADSAGRLLFALYRCAVPCRTSCVCALVRAVVCTLCGWSYITLFLQTI